MFVIIDDWSRFTWVLFLANKSENLEAFQKPNKRVCNKKKIQISLIRSDGRGEFFHDLFGKICDKEDIKFQFWQQELLNSLAWLKERIGL